MTNADKIKQMTNEQLARLLVCYNSNNDKFMYLEEIGESYDYKSVKRYDEAIKRQIAMLESEV